jgi:hypothetical protein
VARWDLCQALAVGSYFRQVGLEPGEVIQQRLCCWEPGERTKQPHGGTTVAGRLQAAEKHARVIELTLAGYTQEAIATACGYSDKSSVRYVQQKWIAENQPSHEQTEELRQIQAAQIDAIHERLWPHLIGDDGKPDVQVVDRVAKLMDRKARLMGLDLQPGMTVNVFATAEGMVAALGLDASVIEVEAEELPAGDDSAESA